MAIWRPVFSRVRALFRRDAIAAEIHEEMQFHVRMRAEDLERGGMSHDDAIRQAARRFGNLAVLEDRGYDVRGGGMLETIVQDVRYAVRLLARQRGFSIVALSTLAVGIGAATALFSVIHAVLLRPLPYPHPEQLVEINIALHRLNERDSILGPSLADVRALRANGGAITHAAVDRGVREVIVESPDPERVRVKDVSEGYFELFGVTPLLGRGITVEDTIAETPAVALLGHAYWRSRFAGDPQVLGRTIRIAGAPTTIVGVMPRGFYADVPIWRPYRLAAQLESFRGTGAAVYARMRAGLSPADAESALTAVLPTGEVGPASVRVELMYDDLVAGTKPTVLTLVSAVTAILMIGCVNVAGLLLARGAIRVPELAIRRSIGAGRGRLVRQLLTESLVLGLAGGLAGVLLAAMALDALVALVPLSIPANAPATMNLQVLGFALAMAMLVSLAAGIVPAIRLSRASVAGALAGAGGRHGSALSRRGGQMLVTIEIALALVLLVGAGLMIRSFNRLVALDLGFDPGQVVVMQVEPVDPSPAVISVYYPALVDAIRARTGLTVGAANQLPIGGGSRISGVRVGNGIVSVTQRPVLPGFLEAMGIPLKAGRTPTDADRAAGRQVVVISEAAAAQIFPDAAPVGRTLQFVRGEPIEVIGVVAGINTYGGPQPRGTRPEIYTMTPGAAERMAIFVRAPRLTAALSTSMQDAARSVGPRVVVDRIATGDEYLFDALRRPQNRTRLLSLLGGIGVLLTLVGVFSVTAYAVARRTQEIGVRMAFGARPSDVVGTMLRDAIVPVALGLAIGLAASYYATSVVQAFLFETSRYDAASLSTAALLLGTTAVLAAWIPARRAAKVDPVQALRAE